MRAVRTVMGFPMSVDIRDRHDASGPVRDAFASLDDADRRFSTYRDDSELALINRGQLIPAEYSDDMREVLAIGASFQRTSRGAFALRIPGRPLDANGVVKGWAVQRACDGLVSAGVANFCFNAGGDVVARGAPLPHTAWNVAVRSPWDAASVLAVFALQDAAIATSGAYERGAHIFDGRSGRVAGELASVSVIAASLTTADVLATAVFALGDDGVEWATENHECSVFAVRADGRLLTSGALPLAASA